MMEVQKKRITQYAILSLLMIVILVALLIITLYPSKSPLGDNFTLVVFYMAGQKLILFASALVFLLRLTVFKKLSGSFPYVFLLLINILIGILAIYLFLFHHYTREFLHDALWNLLMGAILFSDITINDYFKY